MTLLLLHLGCAGNAEKAPALAMSGCASWEGRVTITDERVVYCTEQGLTMRAEGARAEEKMKSYAAEFAGHGYTLEQDVSRPRHFAQIWAKDAVRVTIAAYDSGGDTTISLRAL